ncbi:hypothetical protein [Salinicola tamaricis]|uniref:hypothetical protein n=1 Tax=Salinicola tamaricis TaxID=1771309 RepID=UPI00101AE2F2|nr:hypothetical protein [Salinicola tamaricis]
MSDVLPMADAELTRRVSLYAGVALTPLLLRFADSANWLWRSEELSPSSTSWLVPMPTTTRSGTACVSCSVSTAGAMP